MSLQQRIEISYKEQGPTLGRFLRDRTRRSFIMGPLGSGKTNAACYRAFSAMIEQEPNEHGVRLTRGVGVRNTYPDLFTTTIGDWLANYGDLGKFNAGGLEPPHQEIKFELEDGTRVESLLHFIAFDRPAHVRKARGLPLSFVWLNEVKELSRAVVDMLDLRTGRYQPDNREPTWHGMFGDTNAPDADHWYYRMAEEDKPDGWAFHRQPGGLIKVEGQWILNPLAENVHNLPGREFYYLDGKQGKREDWIAVNFGNQYGFVKDGKAVYEEYIDDVHCREFELNTRWPLHIGLDFGLTPAATISQRSPMGQWRTRYEIVTQHMGAVNFGRLLSRFIKEKHLDTDYEIASITGDPSGATDGQDEDESSVFKLLASVGIVARPAHTQEYSVRREAIAGKMTALIDGAPGYLVHPECRTLRKAHQGAYCLRRLEVAGMDRFKDAPDKNEWSHVAEAEQYGAMGAGEGKAVVRPHESVRRRLPRVAIVHSDSEILG